MIDVLRVLVGLGIVLGGFWVCVLVGHVWGILATKLTDDIWYQHFDGRWERYLVRAGVGLLVILGIALIGLIAWTIGAGLVPNKPR